MAYNYDELFGDTSSSDSGLLEGNNRSSSPGYDYDNLFGPDPEPTRREAEPVDDDGSDFFRGVSTAFKQVPQLGYGLVSGAGAIAENLFGEGGVSSSMKDYGIDGYLRWSDKVQEDSKVTDSLSYSWNRAKKEGDFGALVDWLQYGAGYTVAQGIQILGTGGLGGAVAKTVGVGATKKLASGLIKKETKKIIENQVTGLVNKGMTKKLAADLVANQLSKEALEKMAVKNVAANIGQRTAMAATATGMEGGEIFGGLTSEAEAEGRELSGGELAKAFGATLVAGGLEFAGDALGFDLLMGKSKFLAGAKGVKGKTGRAARGLLGAGVAMPVEAATEYGQTLVELWGQGKDFTTPEALMEAFDAAGLGALGGTIIGGGGGALSKPEVIRRLDSMESPTVDSVIVSDMLKTEGYGFSQEEMDEQDFLTNATNKRNAGQPLTAEEQRALDIGDFDKQMNAQEPATAPQSIQDVIQEVINATPEDLAAEGTGPAVTNPEEIFQEQSEAFQRGLEGEETQGTEQIAENEGVEAQLIAERRAKKAERIAARAAKETDPKKKAQLEKKAERFAAAAEPVVSAGPAIGSTITDDKNVTHEIVSETDGQYTVSKTDDTGAVEFDYGVSQEEIKKRFDTPLSTEVIDNPESAAHGQEVNLTPSDKLKSSETYKVAPTRKHGLAISIENPIGTTRSGTNEKGDTWSQEMKSDYGRIKGTVGYDKDHVDVFIKPGYDGDGESVFVVNQYKENGKFDEHKAVMGAASEQEAMDIYNSNYEEGWDSGKSVVKMSVDEFKTWVKSEEPSKGAVDPVAKIAVTEVKEAAAGPRYSPQEQWEAIADDMSDIEIDHLYKKAGKRKRISTKEKRDILHDMPESEIYPVFRTVDDSNGWPLDENAQDRFEVEEDWDIPVGNFPEPENQVDVIKQAGKNYISPNEANDLIESWKEEAKRIGKEEDHSKEIIISLFDESGELSKPWREAGYTVEQYDIKLGDDLMFNTSPATAEMLGYPDDYKVIGILSQPPCTCFTSTGSQWWKKRHDVNDKNMVNKMFGSKASAWFSKPTEYTKALISMVDVWVDLNLQDNPDLFYLLENPNGGAGPTRIGKLTGLPNPTLTFHPNNYGDQYTKKTLLWGKFNTDLPTANVEPTKGSLMHKLWSSAEKNGGKRSLTPEGFSYSFFMANNTAKGGINAETQAETDLLPEETPIKSGASVQVGDVLKIRENLDTSFEYQVWKVEKEDSEEGPVYSFIAIPYGKGGVSLGKNGYPKKSKNNDGFSVLGEYVDRNGKLEARYDGEGVISFVRSGTPGETKSIKPVELNEEGGVDRAETQAETVVDGGLDSDSGNVPDATPVPVKKTYGKKNVLFTEDAAEAARKILKAKLDQLSSGLDPELMQAGITLAGYHIEAGARSFTDFSKAMIKDLGKNIKPYLRGLYENIRYYPGFDNKEMTSAADIEQGTTKEGAVKIEIEKSGVKLEEDQLEVESKLAKFISENPDEALAQYDKLEEAQGGSVINTDTGRELSPEYVADKARHSVSVHEPVSALMKYKYDKMLAEELPEGKRDAVLFLAGGGGSGKTSAISVVPQLQQLHDEAHIVYDNTFSNKETTVTKIEKALAVGKEIDVVFVARDPYESYVKGVLIRTMNPKDGRVVPVVRATKDHKSSGETVKFLQEQYKDDPRVNVHVIDNTGGFGEAKTAGVDFIDELDYTELEGRILSEIQEKYESGKLSKAAYEGATQGSTQGTREVSGDESNAGVEPDSKSREPAGQEVGGQDGSLDATEREGPDTDVVSGVAGEGTGNVQGTGKGQRPGRVPKDSREQPDGELSGSEAADTGGSGQPRADEPTEDAGREQPPTDSVGGSGTEQHGVSDLRLKTGDLKRKGSWKATAKRNLDIIELLHTLESENRQATPEEQLLLTKYTGFGATEIANSLFPGYAHLGRIDTSYAKHGWAELAQRAADLFTDEELKTAAKSTQYAHYTSEEVISTIYAGVERMGFKGGNILDPGSGISPFLGLLPDSMYPSSRYTGIEMDFISAAIAKHIYPQQNILQADFIKQELPNNFFDLVVGNPPFADMTVLADPKYKKHRFFLHDFFFAKSLDKVRPGGLLVFVTSKGTMDKMDDKARKYMAERADLVGAVRLPQTAFKANAGTEVVTDVLFFRKREEGQEKGGVDWLKRKNIKIGNEKIPVNEYFAGNKRMILGKSAMTGSMYSDKEYTVEPRKSVPIGKLFKRAILQLPENIYTEPKKKPAEATAAVIERDFNPKSKKEGGLYIDDNGNLMQVEAGSGVNLTSYTNKQGKEIQLSAKQIQWLKDYVGLSAAVKQAQYDQFKGNDWKKSLKELNKVYDAFVKKHGAVSEHTISEQYRKGKEQPIIIKRYKNKALFTLDVEHTVVRAIEKETAKGGVVKGDFLKDRTIKPPVRKEPKTLNDALAVTMDEYGALKLDVIADKLGIPVKEAIEGLGTQIYENPETKEYETRDEYLSGNVVEKLAKAKVAEKSDKRYKRNVDALLDVQPKPLGSKDIFVRLGAPWLDTQIITNFAKEVLGKEANVTYSPMSNTWSTHGSTGKYSRSTTDEWGTADRNPTEILQAVLNNATLKVTTQDPKNPEKSITDETSTEALNDVARRMRTEFASWIWRKAERAATVAKEFNRRYNNIAPREFDGSHLTLPGISLLYKLHAHQKRAIWRIIQTGSTYLAHAVGAGKTVEMIAAGMEMKRLGLINKPIYVVPKHVLPQFSATFLKVYPLANVMVADEENFHTENRRKFMAQAAMNSPDAIIITHSSLKKLSLREESVKPVRDKMVADLREALGEMDENGEPYYKIKQMEKRISRLEQTFDSMAAQADNDKNLSFEDLGVDFMFFDEAHEYRKLDFATKKTGIKGIDPAGSKGALDLFIKTKYLQSKNPTRSHVFASGTPVTNTMGELFSIMRFFAEDQMELDGMQHFDAWAAMFGEIAPALERNAAGDFELVERFARFINIPELMKRVRSFMDVLTFSSLTGIVDAIPNIKGGEPRMITTPQSPEQTNYLKKTLAARIVAFKAWKPSPGQKGNPDPIFNITTDGRLAALDMRFINPELPSDPNSKLNVYIDGIIKTHKETKDNEYNVYKTDRKSKRKGGVQLAFYNVGFGETVINRRGFDSKAWMMKRLKDAGIPIKEIAWIEDYKTAVTKQRLFGEVQEGKVRILLGSAKQMGTGMNVQSRLTSLHYLDAPWYPADVEQPLGRILRTGNQNTDVDIFWYATEGSYDSTMWQMVARKAKFIEQAFSGDDSVRSVEDVTEVSMYEMATALSSGDMRLVQLASLKGEIAKYQRLQYAHHDNQIAMQHEKRGAIEDIASGKKQIVYLKEAEKKVDGWQRFELGKIGRKKFETRGEFAEALFKHIMVMDNQMRGDKQFLSNMDTKATLNGYPITLSVNQWSSSLKVALTKKVSPSTGFSAESSPDGNIVSLLNGLNNISRDIDSAEVSIDNKKARIKEIDRKLGAPFAYDQQLAEMVAEESMLEAELLSEGQEVPSDEILATAYPQELKSLDQRERTTPNRAALYSKNLLGESQGTVAELEKELKKILSKKERANLEIDIVQSFSDLPIVAASDDISFILSATGVEGAYDANTGKITLVADNVSKERLWPLLLHEGVHKVKHESGWAGVFGKRSDAILSAIDSKLKAGDKAWKAAEQEAKDAGVADADLREETITYFLASKAGKKTVLWKRIVNAIRRFLIDKGFKKTVTDDDIVALAELAVLRRAKTQLPAGQFGGVDSVFASKGPDYIYHVTRTDNVDNIKKKGLERFKTSNWTTADGERYGEGEIYAFTSYDDAVKWAAKMDWEFNTGLGTGDISIVQVKRKGDWTVDKSDPLSQAGKKGDWIKSERPVKAENIIASVPFTQEGAKSLVGGEVDNPFLASMAKQLGVTPAQLQKEFDETKRKYEGYPPEKPFKKTPSNLPKRQQQVMDYLNEGHSLPDSDKNSSPEIYTDEGEYNVAPSVLEKLIDKGLVEYMPGYNEFFSTEVIEKDNMRKISDSMLSGEVFEPTSQIGTAPNGKPSNLSDHHWILVRTPRFKKWFGDFENSPETASKVIDENGEPLVVYRGQRRDAGAKSTDLSIRATPSFTGNRNVASVYSGTAEDIQKYPDGSAVYQTFLNIKNPVDMAEFYDSDPVSLYEMLGDLGLQSVPSTDIVDILNDLIYMQEMTGFKTDHYRGSDLNTVLDLYEEAIADENEDAGIDHLSDIMVDPFAMADSEVVVEMMKALGKYDGIIVTDVLIDKFAAKAGLNDTNEYKTYRPFKQEDIKSINNTGEFGNTSNIMFSKAAIAEHDHLTSGQVGALEKIGQRRTEEEGFLDQVKDKEKRGLMKIKTRQALVDQYGSFKDILGDKKAWMMAHITKSGAGVLETIMHTGIPFLEKSGSIDIKENSNTLLDTLMPLGEEVDLWLAWVAGNRAAELKKEGKERLFSDVDITELQALNRGTMKDGTNRAIAYAAALRGYEELNNAIVDIGVQTGLISERDADTWKEQGFYVPFYRMAEEGGRGPSTHGKLTNQTAYKKLKGADIPLDDLLTNVLNNWNHIITASLNNQAAATALDSAVAMEMAEEIPENMHDKDSVFVRRDGEKIWYDIEDTEEGRLVMESLLSLNFDGFNNPAMKVMRKFKRFLTTGVTASPGFKIRNLLRDTIHATAVANVSKNVVANVLSGWKETGGFTGKRMIAGGGAFGQSGYIHGNDPEAVKILLGAGIAKSSILNTTSKFTKMWDAYQDFGARLENINRAANFARDLNKEGGSLLEANFNARDQLDFSRTGTSSAIRFIAQTVPFLNARLQGLDKLGRAAFGTKEEKARFYTVVGTYALASAALYMAMKDDDDYKEAEDWEKRTYHLFKIPGSDMMYRLPRPFEVGAIAYMVEKMTEQAVDDVSHKEFTDEVANTFLDTFSFNPIPQTFKPIIELYANKSMFTGREIESLGMKYRSKTERYRGSTSKIARYTSKGMSKVTPEEGTLSPVQIDHLVRAYGGWLSATILASTDYLVRSASGEAVKPTRKFYEYDPLKSLARGNDGRNSKYVTRFYENLNKISKIYGDIRHYKKTNPEVARDMAKKYGSVLKYRRAYNKVQNEMSKLRKRKDSIYNNRDMSGPEKREAVININKRINKKAEAIYTKSEKSFRSM